ncbi:MAG TPA: efflux RND transporter periplasmic adaptor subunit [Bryobacteraceae bacterium]|nr:efflux RND transporter periplasmic adaptor subunit [Bryobacteraceae bacterium]
MKQTVECPGRRRNNFCILLLLTAALVSCGGDGGERTAADPPSDPVLVVPVAKSVRESISDDLTVTGEFIPYQEIDVMAKVAGYIRAINVDIGDRVRTGQVLAQLEVPEMQNDMTRALAAVAESEADITTAQDQLNRAKSARDMAHLSYTRVLDVAKREPGLVPQEEVDEAHAKDLIAEADVSAAQSSLQAAERKTNMAKAEQARWQTLQDYTTITAPFAGVVTKRYANTGSMIQAGIASQTQAMPVIRLSQNSLLRLILPVPESAVPSIHDGETVDVTVTALHRTFPGRVTRFADEVQKSTRTMDTEVDVPNPGLVLVPGMYADVKLSLHKNANALTVPLDAVDETSGSPQVFAVRDSVVRILPVTTGLSTPQRLEIRSGIREGELVITGRHAGLQDGERVQPRLLITDASASPAKGS